MMKRRLLPCGLLGLLLTWAWVPLSAATNFGSVNVGASTMIPITVTVVTAGTLGNISVRTLGAPNLDFDSVAGGTCTLGMVYAANATCTVQVTFAPLTAGSLDGAVVLQDSSASPVLMATSYITGTGLAPQIAFQGSVNAYPANYPNFALGGQFFTTGAGQLAVDASGNLYAGGVKFSPQPNGTYSEVSIGSGFGIDAAVDGVGNAYIADGPVVRVETLQANGSYVETLIGGFNYATTIAVDGSGNLYVGDGVVYKETLQPNGTYVQTTVPTTAASADAVAADAAGDVFVLNRSSNTVYKETPSASTYTESVVSNLVTFGSSLTVSPVGDVYVGTDDDLPFDDGTSGVLRLPLEPDGSYGEFGLYYFPHSSIAGVAADVHGNIWVSNAWDNSIFEITPGTPVGLSFATTTLGATSSDSPKMASLFNVGNAPLQLTGLTFPADFVHSATGECSATTLLPVGGYCNLTVSFKPTLPLSDDVQPLNENISIVDNALNVAGATQNLPVTGSEPAQVTASPVFTPHQGNYQTPQMITITDSTPSSVIYYSLTGTATTASTKYTGPFVLSTATYAQTISAIAVAANYAPSAAVNQIYTIYPAAAAPTFTPPPGSYAGSQMVSLSTTTAGVNIYYTTNGSTPTVHSTQYTNTPISVAAQTTIKAIAVGGVYYASPVATGAYTIQPATPAPTITPGTGTYTVVPLVTLTDTTAGASFYYTTDGSAVTVASTKYTVPFAVKGTGTVNAIAVGTGDAVSPVSTANYVLITTPTSLAYPASAVSTTTAALHAIVNTNGVAGSYVFQYGTSSTNMNKSTAKTNLPASSSPVTAGAGLSGLQSGTTYYFQCVITTAAGTATTTVLSFTTN